MSAVLPVWGPAVTDQREQVGLACWGAMSTAAELAAVSSTLDELTRRVGRILAEMSGGEDDRYGTDLREVERTLGVANRRLERLVAGA